MSIKNIIAHGIGFTPGSIKFMPTLGFSPGVLILQPGEDDGFDTTIDSLLPTTNNETNANFLVGERNNQDRIWRGLIKFDLSPIPSDKAVDSATLTLSLRINGTTFASNNRTIRLYRCLQDWVEAEATWNIYSTGNNWDTAGAGNTTSDRELSDVGSAALVTTDLAGSQHDFDITASSVTDWVDGTSPNYGWVVVADTEDADAYGPGSSNEATHPKPRLKIMYSSSGGTLKNIIGIGVIAFPR